MQKLAKAFKFTRNPIFQLIIAIILIVSSGADIAGEIYSHEQTGFSLHLHHGIFIFGLANFATALGEIGQNSGLAMQGVLDIAEVSQEVESKLTGKNKG